MVFKWYIFRLALSHKLKIEKKKKNKWNASQAFSSESSTLHILSRWAALKNNNKTNCRLHYVFPRVLQHEALVLQKHVFWEISKHTALSMKMERICKCICVWVWNDLYLNHFFLKKATFFFSLLHEETFFYISSTSWQKTVFPFFSGFDGIFS